MEKKYIVSHLILIVIILILGFFLYNVSNLYDEIRLDSKLDAYFSYELKSFSNAINNAVLKNEEVNVVYSISNYNSQGFDDFFDISKKYTSFWPDNLSKRYYEKLQSIESKFLVERIAGNTKICNAICEIEIPDCYFLTFFASKTGIVKHACLDIPVLSSFVYIDSECETKTGYVLVNPQHNISEGNYIIKNVSDSNEFPKICFYKEN